MEDPVRKLLGEELVIINLGLRKFAESLVEQDLKTVQIDWSPPAGGDQDLIALLDDLL